MGDHPARTGEHIRVLCVLDSFSFGGAENLIVELGRHLPEQLSLQVASLAPQTPGRDDFAARFVEVGLPIEYFGVRRLVDLPGFVRMARRLRASDADVVHAHLGYSATLVPLAARLAGKPCVATLHLVPDPHASRSDRIKDALSVRIPAALGRLILVSQHAFDEFARLYGPARPSWRMVPNGVDLERYHAAAHAAAHDAPPRDPAADHAAPNVDPTGPTSPTWAVVAALRPLKGHLDLLAAWQQVLAQVPQARLLIIGEGSARAEIERAITERGLTGQVELLGRREDIPQLLAGVDGVVSASHTEALPTSLIEAAATGLPVVATDAGGTREVVRDGVTGRLVPVGDVDALATALVETMRNPRQAAAFGAAGRTMVDENYSMAGWVDRLVGVYREVLGHEPSASAINASTDGAHLKGQRA